MDKTAKPTTIPISKLRGLSKGMLTKMINTAKRAKGKHYDKPFKDLGERVGKGYRQKAVESGTDSLVLSLPGWLTKGNTKKKVQEFMADNVSMPITKADTALGAKASKIPGTGSLFKIKEKVPVSPSMVGRKMTKVKNKGSKLGPAPKKGNKIYEEVERPSIIAPATKTMNVAVPFAGAYTIDKQLGKLMDKNKDNQDSQKTASVVERVSLEKTAAVKLAKELIRLKGETSKLAQANTNHEKRAKAEKLVYKQASMGLVEYPKSYEDLQEKVASLENQDLDVLEKALELNLGDVSMGKVASDNSYTLPTTPEEQFAANLMDDESL